MEHLPRFGKYPAQSVFRPAIFLQCSALNNAEEDIAIRDFRAKRLSRRRIILPAGLDILGRPKGENRIAHGLQPWEDGPERNRPHKEHGGITRYVGGGNWALSWL